MSIYFATRIFPFAAVGIAILAYFAPQIFSDFGWLIVPILSFIMLGMGTTLALSDFIKAFRHPKAILIGLCLQFTAMPLFAYLMALAFNLPKEQFIGLVMVGAVAGGTASNVIAYIAGANVALSIAMTACSTVCGIFLTPLLTKLYLGQTVDVPVWELFAGILEVVALPVLCGLALNRIFRKHARILNAVCPIVSTLGILFVIAIIISLNRNAISECGVSTFAAVVLHNLLGLTCGFFVAKLLACDNKTAVTIAIETGMQNSGLAAALSKQCFGIAAALPAAIFSIWHNISGAIFADFARRKIL